MLFQVVEGEVGCNRRQHCLMMSYIWCSAKRYKEANRPRKVNLFVVCLGVELAWYSLYGFALQALLPSDVTAQCHCHPDSTP